MKAMRSELVLAAEGILRNRYSLCRLVSTATRKFHRPNTRVEGTTDAVLRYIADASAGAVKLDGTEIQFKTLLAGEVTLPKFGHIDSQLPLRCNAIPDVRLSEIRSSNLSAHSNDLHGRGFLPQPSSTRTQCGARMRAPNLPRHNSWAVACSRKCFASRSLASRAGWHASCTS